MLRRGGAKPTKSSPMELRNIKSRRQREREILPFPLGSFEVEKRRWLKLPLRTGTLSAEKDILREA